ncbi:tripartite motif-containing protein 16 isoform X1 [Myxocyprinus asiaticus]|uniref:tripartite motif-containing protein 16 isoform X1 n=2 Tax=Myxocyprinus asiaticus TaxID=70543 RepID=UPI002222CBC7|nr:tripartite motif-containing protein 16 isoform X1 [Myxocyprinus asiaticus]
MEETAPALHSSGSSDVECVVCIGRKRKAEQACLECMASYCDIHLDLHNTLHVGKRHRLVEANEKLQEKICPDHDKLLEVYCRTDQQCICYLCITDKHSGHDVIKMEKEVTDKQIQLGEMQRRTTDIIEAKEKDMQEIRQAVEAFKTSAQKALENNERNFTELIQSIKDNQSKVTELIQGQAEAAVRQADGFIETLNQGINNLRNINAKLQNLELLSHTNNDVQFLESAMPMPSLNEYKKPFVLLVHPYCSFEHATEAVSELKKKLNIISQWSLLTISGRVKNTGIVTSPPPQTREEFLQYASKLTFNTNTAHESLCLSKGDSQVTATHLLQDYPDHSKRFDCRAQILCNEALRGSPQYWEVEFGGGCWVCIAVSYQRICRKGKRGPLFGRNPYSWGLRCKWASFEFWHNNKQTEVKYQTHCSTIGVYLDHSAGILAFYNASDMSLIYKTQMLFTEPVYPGFGLAGSGSYVRLCNQAEKVSDTSSPAFNFDSSDSSS